MSGGKEPWYEITSVRRENGYFVVSVTFPLGVTNSTGKYRTQESYYVENSTDELGVYLRVKEHLDGLFKNGTYTVLDPAPQQDDR